MLLNSVDLIVYTYMGSMNIGIVCTDRLLGHNLRKLRTANTTFRSGTLKIGITEQLKS